ncbi:MAG TPA: MarR family winged helix-turn-helix transcriptional regulator [Actinomycetota bacterium]
MSERRFSWTGGVAKPALTASLRRVTQAMVVELVSRIEAAGYPGITGSHHPLFENIDPEGTRLTVLAGRAGMTHQSMSELVQTLQTRGYVTREPDPSDRRARLVVLTALGRRMVRRALLEMGRIEREWIALLADAGLEGDLKAAMDDALQRKAGRGVSG